MGKTHGIIAGTFCPQVQVVYATCHADMDLLQPCAYTAETARSHRKSLAAALQRSSDFLTWELQQWLAGNRSRPCPASGKGNKHAFDCHHFSRHVKGIFLTGGITIGGGADAKGVFMLSAPDGDAERMCGGGAACCSFCGIIVWRCAGDSAFGDWDMWGTPAGGATGACAQEFSQPKHTQAAT